MMNLTVNLTSLAAILWSGMLIIAGSIWILSSEVRRLSDLLAKQEAGARREESRTPRIAAPEPILHLPRRTPLRMVERPAARAN